MVHARTCEQRMSRILLPSKWTNAVPDSDLEIRGGGGAVMRGGGWSPPKHFSAIWASVWSKNKKGGGDGSPGPLPWIRHCNVGRIQGDSTNTLQSHVMHVKFREMLGGQGLCFFYNSNLLDLGVKGEATGSCWEYSDFFFRTTCVTD